ncbi:glycoside hydrolase family 5 protein [Sporormia fimetaria CBS 119925]|uniref:mannan endo-1,4-beta-mannosidase n=1 Tax=Sporormia fimetaria CBS 119925 TaxID=1340428 RepID=A0A6A6UYX7_9PLEO|nr:glycoside hydrolase family 5 protein [Sporormia fimetaria CBS 119925]
MTFLSFLTAAFLTSLATPTPNLHTNETLIPPNDFIHIHNLRLHSQSGLHYLNGINYWSCMNLASSTSTGGNLTRLLTELDQLASHGINHVRIMASSEGAPTPQPFRMNPPLFTALGVYDEAVFQGLDRCLHELSVRGIRATMTLGNEWHWSGGFAQYVSWATNNSRIPYPPSWNMTAAPQRPTPRTGWGAYTIEGVDAAPYDAFTNYANSIYDNKIAEEMSKQHIDIVMNRRNSVNGRLYTEDPTIMTWQIANEPQAADPLGYTGPYSIFLLPNPDDRMFPFIQRLASYIRLRSPRQLVSVGLESKQGEYYFKRIHDDPHVDYATTHVWVQNWGVYDMFDPHPENLARAQDFASAFLKNTSTWGKEIGKPVFLEEFGMARNNWEHVGKEYAYLSSAGTGNRDVYFTSIFETVLDDFKSGGAYIGTCPWAYGGIWRPETQVMNTFDMVWAGDPPHEATGWYDLYDTDATMAIIEEQAKDVRGWIEENDGGEGKGEG